MNGPMTNDVAKDDPSFENFIPSARDRVQLGPVGAAQAHHISYTSCVATSIKRSELNTAT